MTHAFPPSARSFPRLSRLIGPWLLMMTAWASAQAPVTAPPAVAAPASIQPAAAAVEVTSGTSTDGIAATPANQTIYQTLSQRLSHRLETVDWEGGSCSIIVQDAELPLTLFERNADKAVRPGQLVQIVTAAAALERLGPSFRFSTELLATDLDPKARSAYSVIARGSGDPTLSLRYLEKPKELWRVFDRWSKILRAHRIKHVVGTVVGDGTAFDRAWQGPGWPEKLGSGELPSVSALNFNDNCITIEWLGRGKDGSLARYAILPYLPKYTFISSDVHIAENPVRGREYARVKEGNLIVATGQMQRKARQTDWAAVEDPARFFAEAFRERMIADGIDVKGDAVALEEDHPTTDVEHSPVPLDVIFSPPLPEMLGRMFRQDLTLDAEVLFKTMGRRQAGPGNQGNYANGNVAIQSYLDSVRLSGSYYNLVDGSGRSEMDSLSVRHVMEVMREARHDPDTGAMFDALFPQAGSDAEILKDRFQQSPSDGSGKKSADAVPPPIWAKTASVDGVEAAAGRLVSIGGRSLMFVILVNDSRMPAPILRRQLDQLLIDLTK